MPPLPHIPDHTSQHDSGGISLLPLRSLPFVGELIPTDRYKNSLMDFHMFSSIRKFTGSRVDFLCLGVYRLVSIKMLDEAITDWSGRRDDKTSSDISRNGVIRHYRES